ncbi:MAG: 50S ribosomal protein L35 [Armatimonadetes bacterium]|nr:50S ribosomal protein L35 [Armatimonadota bacterium]MBS1702121.1 50S ribosomal protein L35 [Armatimonadota bacterium]MBS1728037.1 50S ribosomal protein L35 [Armatimonadota bacterium]
MPKIRTYKTAAKRFKVTGTGKITRRRSHNNHQFLCKRKSTRRALEAEPVLFKGENKRIKRLLVM